MNSLPIIKLELEEGFHEYIEKYDNLKNQKDEELFYLGGNKFQVLSNTFEKEGELRYRSRYLVEDSPKNRKDLLVALTHRGVMNGTLHPSYLNILDKLPEELEDESPKFKYKLINENSN